MKRLTALRALYEYRNKVADIKRKRLVKSGHVVRMDQGKFNLLCKWKSVLLEKLSGVKPVNKFRAFYGGRMLITAFTNASHLSLS